ncbi:hypothetical protein L6J37_21070, partial [Photobacterium sp. WH77]|nr:hypothetical protein [Photobacterium sp. WH77]MCG2846946.1 hypothetical protein [Photobacterium sp. WH80]
INNVIDIGPFSGALSGNYTHENNMNYDRQYYLLTEDSQSGPYMLVKNKKSDEGLSRLLAMRSIKRQVLGPGYINITPDFR